MTEVAERPDGYERTCILWDGGWLQFDAVPSEEVVEENRVTDLPLEPGAGPNLTDHAQPQNVEFSLEIIVTNMPSQEPLTHTDGVEPSALDVSVVLKRPIVPEGLGPISGLANQVDQALRSVTGGRVSLERDQVVQLGVQGYSGALRRVQNVYEELRTIAREARRLTVAIGDLGDFDDCVITSLARRRSAETGDRALNLTIALKQLQFATTQGSVRIRDPEPRQRRGQAKKPGGRTQATTAAAKDEEQVTSTLSRVLGGN